MLMHYVCHVCGGQRALYKSVLSFYHLAPGNPTQDVRLGSKCTHHWAILPPMVEMVLTVVNLQLPGVYSALRPPKLRWFD